MAFAVLARQNESIWAHMGKIPYPDPPQNSNPNPKKKAKQFHHTAANGFIGRKHNNKISVDLPAVTQIASDDANSFNHISTSRNGVNSGGYVTFNVASYTKSELLELRKRLSAELDQVQDLRNRIESGRFNIVEDPRSLAKLKKFTGSRRPSATFGSAPKKLSDGHGNASFGGTNFDEMLKECGKVVAKLIKHKFGFVFKKPVDAVALGLHDYHLIVRRPMDLGTVKANLAKKLYPTPLEFAADVRLTFNNALLYNPKSDPVNGFAEQLLARFEELFQSIQEKINSCFHPKGDREFCQLNGNDELQFGCGEEVQGSSWNNTNNTGYRIMASPSRVKKAKRKSSPVAVTQVFNDSDTMLAATQAHSSSSTPKTPNPPTISQQQQPLNPEQLCPSPMRHPSQSAKEQKVGPCSGSGTLRQPKPRAKDPNKREMSMEEKQKLGLGLQNLPQEKMPQLLHIIRKRNEHLAQDGDEIELDIEALDTETLWELDRFVTNWKKAASKSRRQALMINNSSATGVAAAISPEAENEMGSMSDKSDDVGRTYKENDDEDVDIDDDMPASFPAVEIEKDAGACGGSGLKDHGRGDHGNASGSSSSSSSSRSDSSSSSDSDSGSSSGSDSDADDAQS